MITRERYLEALDIVETYHQQLRQLGLKRVADFNKNFEPQTLYSVGRSLKEWNDLQIGDKVIFSKTMSKDVLPEKEYEVVWIDSDFANQYDAWFTIKCENGKEKGLRKHAKGYRGRVA